MRKCLNIEADLTKIMVGLSRRKGPPSFERLKTRLAVNRGKALGMPKRYPSPWVERRARARWQKRAQRDGWF